MKFTKTIALGLAAVTLAAATAGCGGNGEVEGKINIKVGRWPDDTDKKALATRNELRDKFQEANPDINVIGDTYKYDTKTFTMKASAGQLPNLFQTGFTEVNQIIAAGYCADITEQAKAHGYIDALNPMLLDFVTKDGKIYGLPTDAYAIGLYINKNIFREAGLLDEDGMPIVPDTYEEFAETCKVIKEKTGKAGFILPTTNNCGGWIFMNIAWAFGTDFCEQGEDGKWKSTFDTQEARDALQYVKDLKWKYDAFLPDTVIDQDGMYKYFGSEQGAMIFANPALEWFPTSYGTEIDSLYVTRMPEGPAGRFTQMGGNLWMFSANSTPEQIDAGMTWLEYTGFAPVMTEEQLETTELSYKEQREKGNIVIDQEAFATWSNGERMKQNLELRAKYTNVDHRNYEGYYGFEGVTIKPEPVACCQQLYAILDKAIQEVMTNENADVDALISQASEDYQVNHLDKMDY